MGAQSVSATELVEGARVIRTVQVPRGVSRMGATDCSSTFWDIVDPTCWYQDPLGIDPSLQINMPTCTSGTADQQAACRAAAAQIGAESQVNMDSVSTPALAADAAAPFAQIPTWVWIAGGVGVAALLFGGRR